MAKEDKIASLCDATTLFRDRTKTAPTGCEDSRGGSLQMKGPPEFLGCLPTQIFPDSGRQIRRNLEIRRVGPS
ncbi:hypothetical protein PspLS_08037 [Pyricularia sp. CBS 133598]|nr:hypothetical protein PspLS_08037 [Pyricularia sp. CBS 133598]